MTIAIKDLEFGKNVLKGDYIQLSLYADGLTRIDRPEQLEVFKQTNGNLTIEINRNNPWFSVFSIPQWSEQIIAIDNLKANAIKQFGTNS